jgi:aspartate/methionine/tyrosine aminotransferase
LPENLVAGNGCGPVLEALIACLADAGDCILVPAPFYHGLTLGVCRRVGQERRQR